MTWDDRYRQLIEGEIIETGDECLTDSHLGWQIATNAIGLPAPNPHYTAHRLYRRAIKYWDLRRAKLRYQATINYGTAPESAKTNVFRAIRWSKDRLMRKEGSGHFFHISRDYKQPNLFVCSFAKPEWNADHCSFPYETGAKAAIMAVLEYEIGL